MENVRVLGVQIIEREKSAKAVQDLLTENGCMIRTRLGIHEASNDTCARSGLILLELVGDSAKWDTLIANLEKLDGIKVKFMDFAL